jgi:hypothetical protein
MSGASQQKKKEGNKGKRQATPSSRNARQGVSAGSAAAGHSAGATRGRRASHGTGTGTGEGGDGSPPGKGTFK